MTFRTWLDLQGLRNDAVGDLARAIFHEDPLRSRLTSYEAVAELCAQKAFVEDQAHVLERAKIEWEAPEMSLVPSCSKVLRRPADVVPIEDIDLAFGGRVRAMAQLMAAHGGIGIAAPQVGWGVRVCVVRMSEDSALPMVNPVIVTDYGAEQNLETEACLSLPRTVFRNVRRPFSLRVRFWTLDEGWQEEDVHGLQAAIVQHELDHLDGVLVSDRKKRQDAKR